MQRTQRKPAVGPPLQAPEELVWKAGVPPQLALSGTVLFYPGVGSDWKPPLRLFDQWVNSFMFVDINMGGVSDDLSRSVLVFNLHNDGRRGAVHQIERSVTEVRLSSGRSIAITWLRMDAQEAMAQIDDRIGVFFYRGDSSEGSNLWWLFHTEQTELVGKDYDEDEEEDEDEAEVRSAPRGLFHQVLGRLADTALIVTDGSKGDGDGTLDRLDPNSYSPISQFLRRKDLTPVEAMHQATSFTGPLGHSFECIGCIKQMRQWDKGPVLIWQARSP